MPTKAQKTSEKTINVEKVKSVSYLDNLPTSKLKQALQERLTHYRQLAQGPSWTPEVSEMVKTVLKELLYLDSIVEYEEIK
jgi:hypothetical protein